MTIVELFAGAGGASLGLLRAGFTEVRAVEWDASACATRRAAGLRCDEGDVRDPAHYEGVTADAVWSSFPCQAWSTAGKRLGKDDPRNGWPWTVDVLDQVKPRWFMAENVPGLTHHRGACNGRCADDCARLYFQQTILRELRERFAWVDYRILDAARFGVPQNRERLIIVAGPHAIDWPRETHAPPEELRAGSLFGETRKPWRTVREALGLGGSIVRESGVGAEREPRSVDEPAYTMRVQHNGGGCGVSMMREDPSRGWEAHSVNEPSPAVRAGRPGGGLGTRAASRPELLDKPSPSVMAREVKGTTVTPTTGVRRASDVQCASDVLYLGAGIRRLTPADCAILQDFPPDHPWQGTKTSIYAQIGNAVPGTLAFMIGRAVMESA